MVDDKLKRLDKASRLLKKSDALTAAIENRTDLSICYKSLQNRQHL